MTPTATKTTKRDGLQKVKEAEAAWIAAKDADDAASREYSELLRRYQDLEGRRKSLIYADPELVDHLGVPAGADNPVGKIDQEREGLPDLAESAAKVEHARMILRAKRQSLETLIANNAEAMKEEQYAKDEALRSEYTEAMANAVEIAKRRIGVRQKLTEIAHVCREDSRLIGMDAIADAERAVRRLAENPPATAGRE